MNPEYSNVWFRKVPVDLAESFAIITACNPDGVTVPAEENQQRQDDLRRALVSIEKDPVPIDAGSGDFTHCEPSFMVTATPDEAVDIGKRYRQEAVFHVSVGVLHLIDCATGESSDLGPFLARVV